jgi:hypothetical protein
LLCIKSINSPPILAAETAGYNISINSIGPGGSEQQAVLKPNALPDKALVV